MKQAMDLFGKALTDYKHDATVEFYLIDSSGNNQAQNLSRYYRPANRLSNLEYKLASLTTGKVLDVGSATANYFPAFKSQAIKGIEISNALVKLAKSDGKNCICTNIFDFETSDKYDTITFLENNLGMAGSIPKLKELFYRLDKLLAKNGSILVMQKKVNFKYASFTLIPEYEHKKGAKFEWLNVSTKYLRKVCDNVGFKLEIIGKNKEYNLLKITRVI